MRKLIEQEIGEHLKVSKNLSNLSNQIESAARLCIDSLKDGGKLLIFGNGGSAGDAQHIAAELVGRYKVERKGLSAIALSTDSSIITSISNDFGYSQVFERQIEALANNNDVAIGISTSGKSINVNNALLRANNLGCKTIGFSGSGGGDMNKLCSVNIVVPSEDTPRIQEMHILIGHTICQLIDQCISD